MDVKLYSSIMRIVRSPSEELNKAAGNNETPKAKDPSIITIGSLIKPPKDLSEFEDRLGVFLLELQNLFFGISYEIEDGKTLKRDMSPESLVDILLVYEKRLQKDASLPSKTLKIYSILKLFLEKDVYLFEMDSYLLGVERDRSGLSLPQKNVIAVQCASQVLWCLEGSRIPGPRAMRSKLLDEKQPFFDLLELERFISPITIEKWVSKVCPVPKDQRKKHSKNPGAFDNIILIPKIFLDNRINFLRLRFALISITRVMKALGYSLSEIVNSRPVALLTEPLKFYPRHYASDWIKEAFSSNGSIYHL